MKYMGSKAKITKYIVPIIQRKIDESGARYYVEPFAGGGKYRYLTERECWRLQGYSDADFEAAAAVQKKNGRYTMALYKQAGNSIPVTIFESIFRKIILGETAEKEASNE